MGEPRSNSVSQQETNAAAATPHRATAPPDRNAVPWSRDKNEGDAPRTRAGSTNESALFRGRSTSATASAPNLCRTASSPRPRSAMTHVSFRRQISTRRFTAASTARPASARARRQPAPIAPRPAAGAACRRATGSSREDRLLGLGYRSRIDRERVPGHLEHAQVHARPELGRHRVDVVLARRRRRGTERQLGQTLGRLASGRAEAVQRTRRRTKRHAVRERPGELVRAQEQLLEHDAATEDVDAGNAPMMLPLPSTPAGWLPALPPVRWNARTLFPRRRRVRYAEPLATASGTSSIALCDRSRRTSRRSRALTWARRRARASPCHDLGEGAATPTPRRERSEFRLCPHFRLAREAGRSSGRALSLLCETSSARSGSAAIAAAGRVSSAFRDRSRRSRNAHDAMVGGMPVMRFPDARTAMSSRASHQLGRRRRVGRVEVDGLGVHYPLRSVAGSVRVERARGSSARPRSRARRRSQSVSRREAPRDALGGGGSARVERRGGVGRASALRAAAGDARIARRCDARGKRMAGDSSNGSFGLDGFTGRNVGRPRTSVRRVSFSQVRASARRCSDVGARPSAIWRWRRVARGPPPGACGSRR